MNLPQLKLKGKLIDTHTLCTHNGFCCCLISVHIFGQKTRAEGPKDKSMQSFTVLHTHTVDLGTVNLAAFLPLRAQYGPPCGTSDWPLGPSITASIQWCELWSCDTGSAAVHSSTHLSSSICSSRLGGCIPDLILLFGARMNHRVESLLLNLSIRTRWYCFGPPEDKSGPRKMCVGTKDTKCPPLRGLNVRVSGLHNGIQPLVTVQMNQFTKMNLNLHCHLRENI